MVALLTVEDLPPEFDYPPEFIRVVELGLTDLEPWSILGGERLAFVYSGLRERYPDEGYVPFAARQDNDDVACWSHRPPQVVLVHNLAEPGWERRGQRSWPSFHTWLRSAMEDFIEWGEIELGIGPG